MTHNFKCEICGRNMGDIEESICHQCEVAEDDAIRANQEAHYLKYLEEQREIIMSRSNQDAEKGKGNSSS